MDRIDNLINLLNNPDEDEELVVRELVHEGIGALRQMIEAIRNGPTPSHIILRQAILQMDDPGMLQEMQKVLEDEDPYIRLVAYSYFSRYSYPIISEVLEKHIVNDDLFESDRADAAAAIGERMYFQSVPVLKKQLEKLIDNNEIKYYPRLTLAISYALAHFGDSSGLPYVLKLSKDKAFDVKVHAIQYLNFFSGPGIFTRLKKAISERNEEIRISALDALYYLGNRNSAYELWNLRRHSNSYISEHARWRLSLITGIDEEIIKKSNNFDKLLDMYELVITNDACYRLGKPIDVPAMVKEMIECKPTEYQLIELHNITGCWFGYHPDIWIYADEPDYKSNAIQWLEENEYKYTAGTLYKLGFPQNILQMKE